MKMRSLCEFAVVSAKAMLDLPLVGNAVDLKCRFLVFLGEERE